VCLQTLYAGVNAIFRPFSLENRGLKRAKNPIQDPALGILSQIIP
jgi:hypothetical protein